MRLDLYLYKNFGIQSRNKAAELIKASKVLIDGLAVTKPSFEVSEDSKFEILDDEALVSRAGEKLKRFLASANIDATKKLALDVGSSTGGFAQVLLQNGASEVYCVDVGDKQLHDSLRKNQKIKLFENCDLRDFEKTCDFDLLTCDVSFISLSLLLSKLNDLANDEIVLLFKPQFEVGRNVKRNKKGKVMSENAIVLAMKSFEEEAKNLGWDLLLSLPSEVLGKNGNTEYFYYFRKNNA